METGLTTILTILGAILGPSGAAYVGIRVALNGTRRDVADIKSDLRSLRADVSDVRERVARLEGRDR